MGGRCLCSRRSCDERWAEESKEFTGTQQFKESGRYIFERSRRDLEIFPSGNNKDFFFLYCTLLKLNNLIHSSGDRQEVLFACWENTPGCCWSHRFVCERRREAEGWRSSLCHISKRRVSEFDLSARRPRPNTKTLMLTRVTPGPRCLSFTLIKCIKAAAHAIRPSSHVVAHRTNTAYTNSQAAGMRIQINQTIYNSVTPIMSVWSRTGGLHWWLCVLLQYHLVFSKDI